MTRLGLASVTMLVAVLLLVACSNSGGEVEQAVATPLATPTEVPSGRGVGGTLRLLHWQAPDILNPILASSNKDLEVSRIVYEPLASFDADNNLVLFLAAEEPTLANGGVAPDGKSVTWKLKRDVKWSDGKPFTADDVLFTYEYISNPAVNSPLSPLYEVIDTIEVIDRLTVKINFKEVNPAWAIPFVGMQGAILPRHIFENFNGSNARQAPANFMPVGTGPYMITPAGITPQEVLFLGTDLIQTVKIVFEPNPYFREADKPYFGRVELKGGGTVSEAARSVLKAGEDDFAFNLQLEPEVLDELTAGGKGHMVANFGARVEQIVVNQTDPRQETADGELSSIEFAHPFFSDKRVRQAIAYAIDRPAIAALYGSTGQVTSNNLVAPANYVSPSQFYEYNPEKAKQLLQEAGWVDTNNDGIREKDGVLLHLVSHATVSSLQEQSQQIIRRNLRAVGVDLEVNLFDASAYFGDAATNSASVFRFQADLQSLDISTESPDPGTYMLFWICDQIPQKANAWSGINMGRWCNPQYDELFRQSGTEIDPDKRRDLFIAMNDLQVEDVAMIPLVHLARVSGVSNSIEGLKPTPWDGDVWNIKDWTRSANDN